MKVSTESNYVCIVDQIGSSTSETVTNVFVGKLPFPAVLVVVLSMVMYGTITVWSPKSMVDVSVVNIVRENLLFVQYLAHSAQH